MLRKTLYLQHDVPQSAIMQCMDIRPLKQFLTLADTLHFGRASELCHVSPSTLSRTIRQLEESLDVILFLRDNRHVVLTRQGQIFQQYARETLNQWEQLQIGRASCRERV